MFIILECGDKIPTGQSHWDYCGEAKTVREAEKFIRNEVAENFTPDCITEDFSDYCCKYRICEVVKEVRPVPSVKVSVSLKNVEIGKETK